MLFHVLYSYDTIQHCSCTIMFSLIATAKLPWPNFTNDLAALFHVATATKPPPIPSNVSADCGDFIIRYVFELVTSGVTYFYNVHSSQFCRTLL